MNYKNFLEKEMDLNELKVILRNFASLAGSVLVSWKKNDCELKDVSSVHENLAELQKNMSPPNLKF
jgi:hypothetical protein